MTTIDGFLVDIESQLNGYETVKEVVIGALVKVN